MSVLINMEMPTSCGECPLSSYPHSPCWKNGGAVDWENRPNWCPLIPVPEHGRLIEADRIELYMQDEWMNNELSNGDWILFRERLNETPTIIPAEEATP